MTSIINGDEWSVDANDALTLSLVCPKTGEVTTEFSPTFTYPLYGDAEAIYGYKSLQVQLLFASDDMEPCVKVTYAEKVSKVGGVEAEDTIKPLTEILPESLSQNPTSYINTLKMRTKLFLPPGVLQTSFQQAGRAYEVWRSNVGDARCRELLRNMQLLVLLYIEGGSVIELHDEEWSNRRWEVFFLYNKQSDEYNFIGYCTLYRYYFFNKLSADQVRVRLSQFLILPPYQREGFGSRFYDTIIQCYLDTPEVREITIEDPSQEFSDLRDRRDMYRLENDSDFRTMELTSVIPRNPLMGLRQRAKMPIRQFSRCIEMKLLQNLNVKDKIAQRTYRLIVKSRIYKQHSDVLSQLDRLYRIEKLDETYHHVEDDYRRLLQTLKHSKVEEGDVGGRTGKRMVQEAEENRNQSKRVRVVHEEYLGV